MLHETVTALHSVASELANTPGTTIDVDVAAEYVAAIAAYKGQLNSLPPSRLTILDPGASEAQVHVNQAQRLIQNGKWDDALHSVYAAIGALPGEPGLWPRKVPRPTRR